MECNNIIKRHSSVAKNIELLDHNNFFSLGDKVLWNRKHLHKKYEVPQFAANLKATMQAEESQTISEPTELSPYKDRGYKPFQQTVDRSTFFAENRSRGNYKTIHTALKITVWKSNLC